MAEIKSGTVVPAEEVEYGSGVIVPANEVRILPPVQPRGYVASALTGVPEALWGTWAKGLSLAVAAPAIGIDKLRGMVTGRTETAAQDWVFRNLTDTATQAAQQYALTPEEAANPGKAILHGLGGALPTLAAAALTRGAVGGKELAAQTAAMLPGATPWVLNAAQGAAMMAPAAAATFGATGATRLEQGVDLPTAYRSGAVDAVGAVLQGALPMSVTGRLATRAASGAGINLATGEAMRHAQNAVLEGHPDLQRGFSVQDGVTDAAIGALFAGALGPRPARPAQSHSDQPQDTQSPPAAVPDVPPPAAPPSAPPLALPFSPLAGVPAVFPDGTVALNAEQIAGKHLHDTALTQARAQIAADTARFASLRAAQQRAGMTTLTGVHPVDFLSPTEGADPLRQVVRPAFPPAPPALPPEAPTQPRTAMEQAMERAQRQAVFAHAEQDAAAARQTDLDRIQNLAQAERQVEAAARGQTPANTVSLALPHGDFIAAAEALLAEAPSPRLKQDVARAVAGKKTLTEQVAALRDLQQATQNQQSNRYEYLGRLAEQFTEKAPDEGKSPQAPETLAPAAQGAQAPAVPPGDAGPSAVPDGTDQTAGGPAAPAVNVVPLQPAAATVESNASPGAPAPAATRNPLLDPVRAATVATVETAQQRLAALADEYAARLATREALPETEHDRYARAAEIQQAITNATRAGSTPASSEYLADLARFADDFATPEAFAKAKDDWLASRTSDPDRVSRAILALTQQPRPVDDLLAHLEGQGSEAWVKELAGFYREFNFDTTVERGALPEGLPRGSVAGYNPSSKLIRLTDLGATESSLLHEVTHAATETVLRQVEATPQPRNQAEAKRKQAYDGLEAIRKDALRRATSTQQYGLTDIREFLSELKTNVGFQEFLAKKGLWQRVVEAVRKLVGLPVEAKNALERALDLSRNLISVEAYRAAQEARAQAQAFDASPAKAANVTDQVLAKVVRQVDETSRWASFGRATSHAVLRQLLGWQTKQHIANRAAAVPEFRAAGLADAASAMYQNDQIRRDATTYTQRAAADFAGQVHKALHEIESGAERRRANDMVGRVAVGSSIGGFDPTLNFRDNLAANPALDPRREAHINQTYRDFTALQHAHPEVAKAVAEGAKVNRADLVTTSAVLIDSLLRHAAGATVRLEAELNRMDPAQAAALRARAGVASGGDDSAFAQRHAGRLDFMSESVQNAANSDPRRFNDGASAELHRRLTEVFTEAQTLPKDSTLRAQLAEMQQVYARQIDSSYFHAAREGGYFVNVGFRNMDDATWAKMDTAFEGTGKALGDYTDQDTIFVKVASFEQAAALRRKLLEIGGDKIDTARVRHGRWAEEGRLDSNAGISAALRAVLDTLDDSVKLAGLDAGQAAAMRDLMSRKFLSMLPETSVKTAKLHRAGVPGYDTDFLGSFAQHAAATARDTANLYTMRAYAAAIRTMTDSVAKLSEAPDGDWQVRGQLVRDEMLRRYNNSMTPVDSGPINLINSLGHSFYLALSPAYFIRSMAQPYHRGLPYLGSRYGFVASAKEIGAATGTAMKIITRSFLEGAKADGLAGALDASMKFDGMGLTSKEMAFMREMLDRGTFDLGQARQLQRMALEGSTKLQNAVRVASLTAQYSDMVNRIAVGLAAFRLAERGKPGLLGDSTTMGHMNYADSAIRFIMDDFSPDNTARAIGKHGVFGPLTPLTTAFMNYNLQTMQQIARTVVDGLFSHDTSPEGLQRAREARREFAGLMGTTSMIAGALGLPFASVFAGVYNTLFDDENDPIDIRVSARNWLADHLGATIGEAVAHGPLQALTGIESSSFGMQNLLPGSDFLASRRLLKDRLDELPKTLMGPALNAGMDIIAGGIKIAEGQYVKGIAAMLPSGLKGYWKAGEIAAHGHTDAKGNPIGLPATSWDVAVQAVGLRPAARAEVAEANTWRLARDERLNARKAALSDRIFKAYRFGDSEALRGLLGEVAEFNQANPAQPMLDIAGSIRARLWQEALSGVTGGVSVGSRRSLPVALDETRFLRTGGMP